MTHFNRREMLKATTAGLTGFITAKGAADVSPAPPAESSRAAGAFRAEMREIPDQNKFLVAREKEGAPDKDGWYHLTQNVADTEEGLVCVYRRSDAHTAIMTDIMVCYSADKGRTWTGHKSVAHGDAWNQGGHWVAPQLSKFEDGRLVIISDFGNRNAAQNHPMLAQWQKPDRGMSNHLFWSEDNGKTWTGPHKIDDVGGEPGYIIELSDGTLVYTRTESRETKSIWNPPLPWGDNYYRNVAVFSEDGGKSWNRSSVLSDDPLQGDCEVGLVELSPGTIMAVTRIGFGNSQFGQPSRFIYSHDNGRSWGDHALTPIYGQRTIVRKLQSGNLLVTYRNVWGTPGSYALVWDPKEKLPYQPTSYIWDESRCALKDETMTVATEEGREKGVIFALYPAQAPDSRVEVEAELRVERADVNGCAISTGCFVRFEAGRVSLSERPADYFEVDATRFHHYRLLREKGTISVFVDGELKLQKSTQGIETRLVHFGNRLVPGWFGPLNNPTGEDKLKINNASLSQWRSLRVKVQNQKDHSIDWKWNPRQGFPDQFRRDRMVRLDRNASFSPGNSGYTGWAQTKDGTIVIVDYTVGNPPAPITFSRAYVTTEKELTD